MVFAILWGWSDFIIPIIFPAEVWLNPRQERELYILMLYAENSTFSSVEGQLVLNQAFQRKAKLSGALEDHPVRDATEQSSVSGIPK